MIESRLTSTLSEVKLRKDGGHQPHQAVEDDFQHRQAFIGDQRRIDDGADARLVLPLVGIDVEAQKGVDFLLVQHAFGGAACGGRRFGESAAAVSSGSSAMVFRRSLGFAALLLNDHFLEQHVAHMIGRGGHIDPAQQFLLQAQHAGRAFEVLQRSSRR